MKYEFDVYLRNCKEIPELRIGSIKGDDFELIEAKDNKEGIIVRGENDISADFYADKIIVTKNTTNHLTDYDIRLWYRPNKED